MKKVFLLFTLTLTLSIFSYFKVYADTNADDVFTYEEVIYLETIYENGKIIESKKLKKDDYYAKVKKNKNNNQKKLNDLNHLVINPLGMDPCPIEDPYCQEEDEPQNELIVDVYNPILNMNCYSNYIYCEGHSTRYSEMTRISNEVNLNPYSYTDGYFKTTVTWDTPPFFRMNDYLGFSFDSTKIMIFDETIIGRQYYVYDWEDYECFDRTCYTTDSGSSSNNIYYTIASDPDELSKVNNGVILRTNLVNDTIIGQFDILKVTSFKIELEGNFRITGYNSFRNAGALQFGFDYRHQKLGIDFNFGSSLGANFDGKAGELAVSGELTTVYDSSRYCSVTIQFN